MSFLATVTAHFNIPAQCRRLGVPLWSCPSFLFLIMGLINVCAILASYYIARQYASPELVILVVLGLSAFLFTVSFTIINAFEQVVLARQREAAKHEELVRIKDQFVFIAAHELRTPVTVIKGYASMALEEGAGAANEKVTKYLKGVEQANERLLQLVEDLLEVARSEAGKIVIRVQPVDIRKPIVATVEELKQLAKKKSISLDYQSPQNLPDVLADEDRVREVAMNLINNAIKYTPSNGHVWVSHEIREKEVVTSVKDDGFGIPKEDQEKLFKKFYRVRTEQTQSIEGTGLGLFIVKELVEKMGGKIWVESEEGKGSTFSFSLPVSTGMG